MLVCCHRSSAFVSIGALRASMSLTDLWNAHRARPSVVPTASTNSQTDDRKMSSNATVSPSPQNKRKRLDASNNTTSTPKVSANTAKKPVRSFSPGQTDLGSGCIILVRPEAFKNAESQELYKSMKVCKLSTQLQLAVCIISSCHGPEMATLLMQST